MKRKEATLVDNTSIRIWDTNKDSEYSSYILDIYIWDDANVSKEAVRLEIPKSWFKNTKEGEALSYHDICGMIGLIYNLYENI